MNGRIAVTAVVLSGLLASGCSMTPPKPWQKGALARPEMTMGGDDALGHRFTEHVYSSKEGSAGGEGVGGGGCGCN